MLQWAGDFAAPDRIFIWSITPHLRNRADKVGTLKSFNFAKIDDLNVTCKAL